jgi:hypothetical protein
MNTTLRYRDTADGPCVVDTESGSAVWWPHEDTIAEIESADDPAAMAVCICETAPSRGVWHS